MESQTFNNTKEPICISIAEMATTLGIGLTNAYAWTKDAGFYPARRVGKKRIVIDYKLLRKWLAEQNHPGVNE